MRPPLALAATALLALTGLAGPAVAADDDLACGPEDVVVVVDAEMLDGDVEARCVPVPEDGTMLTAVEDAGFVVEGTAEFGSSVVCRVDGFPTERQETCRSMPAADAYWGSWVGADDTWGFAQEAVDSQPVSEGDVVALAFQAGPDERQPALSPAEALDQARPVDDAGRPQSPSGGLPWTAIGLGAGAVVLLGAVLVVVLRRRPS